MQIVWILLAFGLLFLTLFRSSRMTRSLQKKKQLPFLLGGILLLGCGYYYHSRSSTSPTEAPKLPSVPAPTTISTVSPTPAPVETMTSVPASPTSAPPVSQPPTPPATFTFYHVDWCGHCQKFGDTWDRITHTLQNNGQLQVRSANCTDETQCPADLRAFPTLRLQRPNQEPIDFPGSSRVGRSHDGVLQFLRDQGFSGPGLEN